MATSIEERVPQEQRWLRRADGLVDLLGAEILSGARPPGSSLPTEAQVAASFGASRTVVREAMARLERAGLIQIRRGSGTFVRDRKHWAELDRDLMDIRIRHQLIADLAPDLLDIRREVEVYVAGLAARRRTAAHLSSLRDYLTRMKASAGEADAYIAADLGFHDTLLDASGNVLLRAMLQPVNQLRRLASQVNVEQDRDRSRFRQAMEGHQEIVEAVVKRDEAGARAAMLRHVEQFERDLLASMVEGDGGRSREDFRGQDD